MSEAIHLAAEARDERERNMTTIEEIERKQIERFFDEVQAHIVLAGGNKHPTSHYRTMTVEDLAILIWPNGLQLKIENEKWKR